MVKKQDASNLSAKQIIITAEIISFNMARAKLTFWLLFSGQMVEYADFGVFFKLP